MALEPTVHQHRLACGRTVEDLFEELLEDRDSGRTDAHMQTCPHCQAAAASLRALHEATEQLVADPVDPPARLMERIMSAVRAELRRGSVLPLPADLGPAEVTVRTVAVLLRYAADTVTGVRARSCQLTTDPEQPHILHVHMTLSVRYAGPSIQVLVNQVRQRVTATVHAQLGLQVGTIDLELVDIWDN